MTNIISIDAITGEETIIELTKAEIDKREAAAAAKKAEEEANAAAVEEAKAALLQRLGITADEAKLLLA